MYMYYATFVLHTRGGSRAPPPPPPSPKIGKNMIFWRKIVIFHTKYPKYTGSSAEALGLRASNIYIHMRLSRRRIAQIKEVC